MPETCLPQALLTLPLALRLQTGRGLPSPLQRQGWGRMKGWEQEGEVEGGRAAESDPRWSPGQAVSRFWDSSLPVRQPTRQVVPAWASRAGRGGFISGSTGHGHIYECSEAAAGGGGPAGLALAPKGSCLLTPITGTGRAPSAL